MRTILAGNWKMHTDRADAVALARVWPEASDLPGWR